MKGTLIAALLLAASCGEEEKQLGVDGETCIRRECEAVLHAYLNLPPESETYYFQASVTLTDDSKIDNVACWGGNSLDEKGQPYYLSDGKEMSLFKTLENVACQVDFEGTQSSWDRPAFHPQAE